MAKKQQAITEKAMDVREIVTALYEGIPELKEAISPAELELALDDRGWVNLGYFGKSIELDPRRRQLLVAQSRAYWSGDPLAQQAVRLWTDYGFGNGLTYKAEDPSIQKKLDKFMHDRRNQRLLSAEGQQRLSRKFLIDGDLFFAIFHDGSIRTIDPLQVTHIITDPDDDEHILCYRRETANNKVLYYADWSTDDAGRALAEQQKDPDGKGPIKLETDVVVYPLAFNAVGKRGNGLLFSVLGWTREHRRFMEARVALTQALAKFAWKLTAKGGQAALDALAKKVNSSLSTSGLSGGPERNPPPAPGSSWVQNLGLDMAPMPRTTGAGDAKDDGNSLKLMVSAGTGIMLHYFGDPSTGNLATATAMELPMLKMFSSYQKLWADAYRDIFSIVLEEEPDAERAVIDIDLPQILEEDLTALGTFLTQASLVFPEMKVEEVLKLVLDALRINNVDEVLKSMAVKRKEIDAQQKAEAALLAQRGAPAPGAPAATPAQEAQTEALTRVAEALEAPMDTAPLSRAIVEVPAIPAPITNVIVEGKAKKIKKTGTATRQNDGSFKFAVEEERDYGS